MVHNMATQSEILRTASLLVNQYGEMAAVGANIRADHLYARGDHRGHAVWLRIAEAADDLLSDHRGNETLH